MADAAHERMRFTDGSLIADSEVPPPVHPGTAPGQRAVSHRSVRGQSEHAHSTSTNGRDISARSTVRGCRARSCGRKGRARLMSVMYGRLVDLLVDRFEVDRAEISAGTTFEDLDMDSLFLVELLLVIQSELGVDVSDDAASPGDTITAVADLIERLASAEASA
ncbi:acyl carrier protein [Streptomyces sp. NPDC058694]|uniref:acyl carrier protein n=1 Tax=Streptomyces sp. NPDC058694 TaxID=3346603 RepID=UPI0036552B99